MTYREPAPLRVIKTRVALLPDPMREVLLRSKIDPRANPPSVPLDGRLRAGVFLLAGVVAAGAATIASTVANLNADNATLGAILAMTACASFGYGLVNAVRSMTLRLQFRATLFADGWLACTEGIGDRVDLIPLKWIDRVVPGHLGELEVFLREGRGILRYRYSFEIVHTAFFDAVRAAVGRDTLPGAMPAALDRDVPPYSRVPSIVIAAIAGLAIGLPLVCSAVAQRVRRDYAWRSEAIEPSLREHSSQDRTERARNDISTIDSFLEYVSNQQQAGGLPWFFMRRMTDVESREARYRSMRNAAQGIVDGAAAAAEDDTVSTSLDRAALRRIANDHPDTTLAARALARIAVLADEARARAAAGGAPAEQLALCDALRAAVTATPRGGLGVEVRFYPVLTESNAFYAANSTGRNGSGMIESAHEGFHSGLRETLEAALSATFDAHLFPLASANPGLSIEVSFSPTTPALMYERRERNSRRVLDAYSYPNIAVTVHGTLRANAESAPIAVDETFRAEPSFANPESMAQQYPTVHDLYRSLAAGLGARLAQIVEHRLCLY